MLSTKKVRILFAFVLMTMAFLLLSSPAFANSLRSQLQSGGGGQGIVEVVDQGSYAIVDAIRQLAVIAFFILVIIIGITYFGSGDNEVKLSRLKSKAAIAVLCLILIFKTESIVVSVFKFFGIENFLR